MEWIVELFGELLTEVFCGVFVHLSQFFLPDKPISKRTYKALEIAAAIVSVLLYIGTVIGVIMLIYRGVFSVTGWILVGAGILWLTIGIVLFVRKRQ